MAPAFDAGDDFAFDKPADTPCPNLGPDDTCTVHDQRIALGLGGCLSFDCHGAGQRVTQVLFAGADWRGSDDVKIRMSAAYRQVVRLHAMLVLLDTARAMDIPPARRAALDGLIERGLANPPPDAIAFELEGSALLQGLREFVTSS